MGLVEKPHIKDTSKPRSSGNELGAEVLRRMLAPSGWRVEQIYFAANYGYHIDTLMPVIREGLIAVNENVLLTDLPAEINDWERINIDRDEYIIGAGNSVSLSGEAQAVTAGTTKYMKALEKRGVEVVPVPFDDVYHFTGNSMRCAAFSYWREDTCSAS